MREAGISRKTGGIEIDAVRGAVGKPLFFQGLDQRNLIRYRIRGFAPDGGRQDIQPRNILLEGLGIMRSDFPGGFPLALSALFELVLTHVAVTGQMTDVGDVHDVFHAIAVEGKRALQDIFK